MGKPVQVGLAQDDTDIRVGDQQATLVHHVGRTGFPDMDARDHIPDEFQVDLRDRDAGGSAGAGNRQGEIGLRLLAEIDLAQVALVGSGVGKLGLLAEIRPARQRIHGKA